MESADLPDSSQHAGRRASTERPRRRCACQYKPRRPLPKPLRRGSTSSAADPYLALTFLGAFSAFKYPFTPGKGCVRVEEERLKTALNAPQMRTVEKFEGHRLSERNRTAADAYPSARDVLRHRQQQPAQLGNQRQVAAAREVE